MTTPGWFPDPSDPSRQRYFDGRVWTENYAPFGPPTPPVASPPKPGVSTGVKVLVGVGAVALVVIVLGSIANGNDTSTTPTSSNGGSVGFTPTTTKSPFTPGQDNAIAKAKVYLSMGGFSKQGLVKQLEYEKFSPADATFAVEHLEASGDVNWNEEAVKKAKVYLGMTGYSLQGLIQQLEYEGFTPSEAQYGANKAYTG